MDKEDDWDWLNKELGFWNYLKHDYLAQVTTILGIVGSVALYLLVK